MSDINHALAAPLARGLYLEAAGRPCAVVPGEPPAGAAGAFPAVELPGAAAAAPSAAPSAAFDEAAASVALKTAFASWRSSRGGRLPACVAVSDGPAAVAYYAGATVDAARARAAARAPGFFEAAAAEAGPAETAASRAGVVNGRIALVTGGAQGFGEEIVRGLAAAGALVYVADLNLAGAEKLSLDLNSRAGATVAIPVSINVTDEASVRAAFAAVAAASGGLDLVVSNAGVLKAASVLEQDAAAFRFVTEVNYTGFFLAAKHAGLLLRRQHRTAPAWWSDLVQINSKSGLQGSNKNGSYAGSKFGGIGLVQSFALELVEHRVKVNAICPGNFFDGPLWSDPVNGLFVQYLRSGKVPGAKDVADVKAFYEAKVPMGRGCEGRDVMRALFYLVEQEYETGQALPVTGGQVMLS